MKGFYSELFLLVSIFIMVYAAHVSTGSLDGMKADRKSYQELAYEVASNRTFDLERYNCWDYSTDLVQALKDEGYDAKIVIGTVDCKDYEYCNWNNETCTGSHAWVEVTLYIEATTGSVIPMYKYDRCYTFGYYGVPKMNGYR